MKTVMPSKSLESLIWQARRDAPGAYSSPFLCRKKQKNRTEQDEHKRGNGWSVKGRDGGVIYYGVAFTGASCPGGTTGVHSFSFTKPKRVMNEPI